MAQTQGSTIEAEMKDIIQNLFNLIAQVVDHAGAATEAAMKREISELVSNLIVLAGSAPQIKVQIPREIIMYVQEGRNPDIYTREFVEVVMKKNQRLKGKTDAFAQFRDVLAREMVGAIPELKNEVRQVVEHTGGSLES